MHVVIVYMVRQSVTKSLEIIHLGVMQWHIQES